MKGTEIRPRPEAKARAVYEEAKKYMVGGVNAGGRYDSLWGRPFLVARGEGCRVWDVDGNEYIDFSQASGAMIHGYNHPALRQAVLDAVDVGAYCNYESEMHGQLARMLCEIVPSAERVRLSNTGTEATMGAIRLARAYTGKNKILKFEGHFHGMHDYLFFNWQTPLTEPDPEGLIRPATDTAGIPPSLADLLMIIPFNDVEALERTVRRHRDELAAIILEPIAYNQGCIPAEREYLQTMRRLATENGIVLIFDEVLSGFRTGAGCAQEYLGVTPDLTTLAKALGGGMPISALVGKREIMDVLSPVGHCVMSGTYTGHLTAVASAIASVTLMRQPSFYPDLWRVSQHLYDGLNDLFKRRSLRGHVQGIGARFGWYFGVEEPVTNLRQASRFDPDMTERFLRAARDYGLYFHHFGTRLAPMHYGTSSALTVADVDWSLDRIETVFRKLEKGEI
jgi:glutamate-1-semialdehyde 2,1-aminomutase